MTECLTVRPAAFAEGFGPPGRSVKTRSPESFDTIRREPVVKESPRRDAKRYYDDATEEVTVLTRTLAAVLGFVIGAGGSFTITAQPSRRYINPRSAANGAQPPFSGAVLAGDTLYVSGTLGLEANRVPETAEAEATNVLNNVQNVLKAAGMTMDDLVSVQVFCADVAHYDAFNKVYRSYFKQEYPARAFLGSGKLLNGARFEVLGIAVKR